MEEIVYLNGEFIPRPQAKLSPFDHGFLYGYGVFETMRAYQGSIFRLNHHLDRLQQATQSLNIALQTDSSELEKACYKLLMANSLKNARLRLTISAGEGDITPNPATCKGNTIFIAAQALIPSPPETYERGYTAVVSSRRRNSRSPLSRLKSTCYLDNILAKLEAKAAGADEAVLLNEQGFLVEGSTTNIFLVSCQMLITPSIESGALPGITRQVVLELAQSMGVTVVVKQVELGELITAREAFLTNSILEIMPLTRLNNKPIGSGRPGNLTQQLISAYRELVAKETARNHLQCP